MKAQATQGEKVADAGMRFAFYGRVSTEDNQDPTLSLPRQLANCERAVAEAGGCIVAHFYDVESGAMRLEGRGSGKGLVGFDIPIPRDGGLADLIEVASSRGFDAVVCESIHRLSRNPSVTFRVEEQLADEGVRLWAIDEPFDESFGSIVLRHVNVGLARGYLHELKVKSRQGIETAAKQVPEGKTVKNRLHLDVNPTDREQDEEVRRLLDLGARHATSAKAMRAGSYLPTQRGTSSASLRIAAPDRRPNTAPDLLPVAYPRSREHDEEPLQRWRIPTRARSNSANFLTHDTLPKQFFD